MDRREFECILPALSTKVVELIAENNDWNENTAIGMFMRSVVYDRLQDETTEAWRFSARMLADLFEDERNGKLGWPEAVR